MGAAPLYTRRMGAASGYGSCMGAARRMFMDNGELVKLDFLINIYQFKVRACRSQKIHNLFTENYLIFLKKYDIIYIEKKKKDWYNGKNCVKTCAQSF